MKNNNIWPTKLQQELETRAGWWKKYIDEMNYPPNIPVTDEEKNELFRNAIAKLDDRDKSIMETYFFTPQTMGDIAVKYSLSRSRIAQRINLSLSRVFDKDRIFYFLYGKAVGDRHLQYKINEYQTTKLSSIRGYFPIKTLKRFDSVGITTFKDLYDKQEAAAALIDTESTQKQLIRFINGYEQTMRNYDI